MSHDADSRGQRARTSDGSGPHRSGCGRWAGGGARLANPGPMDEPRSR